MAAVAERGFLGQSAAAERSFVPVKTNGVVVVLEGHRALEQEWSVIGEGDGQLPFVLKFRLQFRCPFREFTAANVGHAL